MNAWLEQCLALNGRHRGETVFILGAGPQLAKLTQAQLSTLAGRVTIGLNRTTYKLQPTYFLSAYIGQVLLAQLRAPHTTLFHMRPKYEAPLAPGIIPLRRQLFAEGGGLHDSFTAPEPVLLTRRNVALGATHLAFILGAREIVCIGVEQQNAAHFFNYEPNLQQIMRQDIERLRAVPFLNVDHPYATYEALIAKHDTTAAEEEQKAFYKESHMATFRAYIDELRRHRVDVVTTARQSVVTEAGGDFASLHDYIGG